MEEFIKEHTTIPKNIIDNFFFITNKSHNDTDIIINFNNVVKLLDTNKTNLKNVLIKNFEESIDYIIKQNNIKISSSCFKELCMISQTAKAKEVRKYYLELEKIVKKYNKLIEESLYEKIGLLKENKKVKKHDVGGVIYIIEALNVSKGEKLFKLGKTGDLEKRIKTYNTGNANNIKILFKIYVKDMDSVETCVKKALQKYQYRQNKEVYEIDINMIKSIVKKCDEFADELKSLLEKNEEKLTKKIKRIQSNENKIYMIIKEDTT